MIELKSDIDEIRAGIFRIEERLCLLGNNDLLDLPEAISTKLPCETIDELIALNSMDEQMLINLVCILNYEIMIDLHHFELFLLTSYISLVYLICTDDLVYTPINDKCVLISVPSRAILQGPNISI